MRISLLFATYGSRLLSVDVSLH